jgi:hypothetical protein
MSHGVLHITRSLPVHLCGIIPCHELSSLLKALSQVLGLAMSCRLCLSCVHENELRAWWQATQELLRRYVMSVMRLLSPHPVHHKKQEDMCCAYPCEEVVCR